MIIITQIINSIFLSLYLPFGEIKLIDFFTEQSLTIKIIWLLTAFFILLFLVFFITLIIARIVRNSNKRKAEILNQKLQNSLSFYLFDESMQDILPQKINSPVIELFGNYNLNNAFTRTIVLRKIIKLHNNYSGEFAGKLENLFLILGFDKEIEKRIVSLRWNIKANAIKDAAQMNLVQYATYILNLINHPNPTVRTEARVASVKLNREDPFSFFSNLKFNMSDWDQIRIHEALMLYKNAEVPLMRKWLDSSNESVIVFSLKIMGHYNQQEGMDLIIECLNYPSEKIKIQAVKTLGELGSKESLLALFDCLKNESGHKKLILQTLQSLKLIGIFDTDADKIIEFLYTNDYDIIFSSCLTIKSAPNGSKILEKIIADAEDEVLIGIMKYALFYSN